VAPDELWTTLEQTGQYGTGLLVDVGLEPAVFTPSSP
jgi:hypothetical protein